jgi:hypothetical protein
LSEGNLSSSLQTSQQTKVDAQTKFISSFFDFFIITVHSIFLRRTEKSDRFVVLCVSGGDIAFEMKKVKRAEERKCISISGRYCEKMMK